MGLLGNLALFAGGALFGSAGIKLLTSEDAKNFYAYTLAAALRAVDTAAEYADIIRGECAQILDRALEINDRFYNEQCAQGDELKDDEDEKYEDDKSAESTDDTADESTDDAPGGSADNASGESSDTGDTAEKSFLEGFDDTF